jgi:voltage-gated sodium channel
MIKTIKEFKKKVENLIDQPIFQRLVVGLILLNCVTLGMEAYPSLKANYGDLLYFVDHAILGFFAVEVALRLWVKGKAFWRNGWAVFDFAVVAMSLMPASEMFSILRALRVLRAFRLVSAFPQLRRVVGGLMKAIPGVASIAGIMFILFFIFAVMATKLYGAGFPDWFGNLNKSLFTLFQIMTLEGWADIYRAVETAQPGSWIFFIFYILVTTFTVLNLFVAVMIDAIQQEHNIEPKKQEEEQKLVLTDIRARLEELSQKVDRLTR